MEMPSQLLGGRQDAHRQVTRSNSLNDTPIMVHVRDPQIKLDQAFPAECAGARDRQIPRLGQTKDAEMPNFSFDIPNQVTGLDAPSLRLYNFPL